MRVRKIDPVAGRQFGGGQAAFFVDQAEGVAQNVKTRLGLWRAQWFLNLPDGTPWATAVLGKYTEATRDLAIKSRILGTPGVKSIVSYSVSLDRSSRQFTGSIMVDTVYGATTIQGPF